MSPHYYRKQTIKVWFLLILTLMAIVAFSCRPQRGCYGTRGMSGYSWIKNKKTKEVFIQDSTGHIITCFKDGTNMLHSKQSF